MEYPVNRCVKPYPDSPLQTIPKPDGQSGGIPPGQENLSRIAHRWTHAGRALSANDQPFARQISAMIQAHPVNDPAIREDPLEIAVFSLFIGLLERGL